MSNAKFTPGPWRAAGEHVFSVKGRLTVTRANYGTETEREANARLIAAAPELLEALEGNKKALEVIAVTAAEMGFDQLADIIDDRLNETNAAIVKALGNLA